MNSRTRIKVCGLTRAQDVDAAVAAGVDAIGLVFYPRSRRLVSIEQARALRQRVPAFVCVTALFVDAAANDVQAVLNEVGPDLLQFHGAESAAFCNQFGVRYLKAFRVGAPGQDTAPTLAARCLEYPQAAGWLFDSYSSGYGGSGQRFDLSLLTQVPREPDRPAVVLSGGLTAESVGSAVAVCRPFGVDVSSGVESGPGLKDGARIFAFVHAVALADDRRTLK
ncbi:MAG TPA: phosphoribosylanthranilate isomerase [Castellaniella sp.]|uniref:phosphoribosylanthranilate isomerase n=1 Tax=Castellaniella sp. TaxID=1955812 RepID=UPI002EDE2CE7